MKRIIVCTNSNLAAPKNYESVGFILYERKLNEKESAYSGDYLKMELFCTVYVEKNFVNVGMIGLV